MTKPGISNLRCGSSIISNGIFPVERSPRAMHGEKEMCKDLTASAVPTAIFPLRSQHKPRHSCISRIQSFSRDNGFSFRHSTSSSFILGELLLKEAKSFNSIGKIQSSQPLFFFSSPPDTTFSSFAKPKMSPRVTDLEKNYNSHVVSRLFFILPTNLAAVLNRMNVISPKQARATKVKNNHVKFLELRPHGGKPDGELPQQRSMPATELASMTKNITVYGNLPLSLLWETFT